MNIDLSSNNNSHSYNDSNVMDYTNTIQFSKAINLYHMSNTYNHNNSNNNNNNNTTIKILLKNLLLGSFISNDYIIALMISLLYNNKNIFIYIILIIKYNLYQYKHNIINFCLNHSNSNSNNNDNNDIYSDVEVEDYYYQMCDNDSRNFLEKSEGIKNEILLYKSIFRKNGSIRCILDVGRDLFEYYNLVRSNKNVE
jgi:hypothetical protein